jgi:hypothetical protein
MTIPSHVELDRARQRGDAAADAVIAELGKNAWAVSAMLRHVHTNAEPLPAGLPPAVRHLFHDEVRLPAWFDPLSAERAARWSSAHLLEITLALFCASLPSAYAAARGARVLSATGRMQGEQLDRRVNETAQFVLEVLAPNAFAPSGTGLRALQKVRLLHAAVRRELAVHGDFSGELPINQEDMLGTLFTFSVVVIRAVRLLGVPLDDQTAEDYYQMWRAIGVMLGSEEQLVPETLFEAEATCRRVSERQHQSSEHGRALFRALLTRMEAHAAGLGFAPRYLVRYLAGERVSHLLGLEETDGLHDALAVLRLFPGGSLRALGGVGRGVSALLARPLLDSVIAGKLGGRPASYALSG